MDSPHLLSLAERVEAAMIRSIDFHFATKSPGWRTEAAEYAAILLALRALSQSHSQTERGEA